MEQTQIDCKAFVELIQLIADDEATVEQKSAFKAHYNKCGHCAEHYNIDKATLEFIKAKLCACKVDAPIGLADKIRQKIASTASS